MNRLLIQVIYDSEGILDEYLFFYLDSLSEICDDAVFVINGLLEEESKKRLQKYTERIFFRDNKGYDAGAYKDVLENYLLEDEFEKYREIVFSNSTCFGPFVSFKEIFESMKDSTADFWGLALEDTGIEKNLISNFLVFKKSTYGHLRKYFSNNIMLDGNWEHASLDFEIGLFKYLKDNGFKYNYYCDLKRDNIYECPHRALSLYEYPLLKIRCLSNDHYVKENFYLALRYIRENTDYDLDFIFKHLNRRFEFVFEKDYYESNLKEVPGGIIRYSKEQIKEIAGKENSYYIYGTGYWAQYLYEIIKEIGDFKGFICSDGYPEIMVRDGFRAINLSKLKDNKTFIIVGMDRVNTNQVKENLVNYRFLNIWKENEN